LHDVPVRGDLFCNLSVQAAQRLNEIKAPAVDPKGAMLFIEAQQSRGFLSSAPESEALH
jgi:hypothetical protein